jgi:hypothetical protein
MNEQELFIELNKWLAANGWMLLSSLPYAPNRLEIHIKKAPANPPPLGIHITEGVGTEDKVGG